MSDILTSIQAKAKDLGLTLIGITSPKQMEKYPVFENWVSRKHFSEMKYLDNRNSYEMRKNPALLMPECQSIISVGLPYTPCTFNYYVSIHEVKGRIASYAYYDDYHQAVTTKLYDLLHFLQSISEKEIKGRAFCDSAPLPEKELGQRAGLGWIGKNSLLISPTYGSFFTLGELFINIELEISTSVSADLCGECRLCIDTCPTHCIQNDRTLNADNCISYLTIEHKSVISHCLRTRMGNWLFGCDICQMVCPWNRKLFERANKVSVDDNNEIDLTEAALITEDEFSQQFYHTPIKRIGRKRFIRNVAIALGNSGSCEAFPILEKLLQESEPLIRLHAAWGLGKFEGKKAREKLEKARRVENNAEVIKEIDLALSGGN